MSAHNATGQGPKSEAIGVTPLAPLTRVYLELPADGEVVTSVALLCFALRCVAALLRAAPMRPLPRLADTGVARRAGHSSVCWFATSLVAHARYDFELWSSLTRSLHTAWSSGIGNVSRGPARSGRGRGTAALGEGHISYSTGLLKR